MPEQHLEDMLQVFTDGPNAGLLARLNAYLDDSSHLSDKQKDAVRAFRDVAHAALDTEFTPPAHYLEDDIAKLAYKAAAAGMRNDYSEALSFWWQFLSYTRSGTFSHQRALGSVTDTAMHMGQSAFALAVARCALAHYRLLSISVPDGSILHECGVAFDSDGSVQSAEVLAGQLPVDAATTAVEQSEPAAVWVEIPGKLLTARCLENARLGAKQHTHGTFWAIIAGLGMRCRSRQDHCGVGLEQDADVVCKHRIDM